MATQVVSVKDTERFLGKFTVGDDCWVWDFATNAMGYGAFYYSGRAWLAHRFSWLFFEQQDPLGLCVLHTCDNPPCVNPDHLWIGNRKDNAVDRENKGRNNIAPAHRAAAAKHRSRASCKRGHARNEENTYTHMDRGYRVRTCRVCERLRSKKTLGT